jgi:hypothetical protein
VRLTLRIFARVIFSRRLVASEGGGDGQASSMPLQLARSLSAKQASPWHVKIVANVIIVHILT